MYEAALDLSGNEATFAVRRHHEKLLIDAVKPMRGRTASSLAPWVIGLLHDNNLTPEQINCWSVGSGPGSFTGMRLAAALVTGLTAEKPEVKTRCVPSALALAHGDNFPEGATIAALFDGRNQEIIVYGMEWHNHEFKHNNETAILNREAAVEYFNSRPFNGFLALEVEKTAIEKIFPPYLVEEIIYRTRLNLEALLNADYIAWDNDLTKLVYIRPAVHSQETTKK